MSISNCSPLEFTFLPYLFALFRYFTFCFLFFCSIMGFNTLWCIIGLPIFFFSYSTHSKVTVFEAVTRKEAYIQDGRKVKWAMYDSDGIISLNGGVNGRSNDILFPNVKSDTWRQQTCNRNPSLIFQLCETDRVGPWTGLAICYESQLAQLRVNPFYRLEHGESMKKLIRVICGDLQGALLVNRTVNASNPMPQGTGRYDQPFYVVYSSYAPKKKIYFQMPDRRFEKQCVLLIFGGEKSILEFKITDLRREPIPMFKGDFKTKWNTGNKKQFMQEFPDMANRKFKLNKRSGIELTMLDFMPPYGYMQNISIFGWLPITIKAISKSIDPCRVEWKLLQGREFRGHKGDLELKYSVQTGLTKNDTTTKGGSQTATTDTSKTQETNAGVSLNIAVLDLSYSHSWQNTQGAQDMVGMDFNFETELSEMKTIVREECIIFGKYQGTVNVEQMVMTCHGVDFMPDKIRYQDERGRQLMPDSVEDNSEQPVQEKPKLRSGIECTDTYEECQNWAANGQCNKEAAQMRRYCRASCRLCPSVNVKADPKTGDDFFKSESDGMNSDEESCDDLDQNCPKLAQDGECQKSPAQMSRFCRRSCELCVSEYDHDFRAELDQMERNQK